MSEFIDFEAEVEDDIESDNEVSGSECDIVDDEETGNDLSFYRSLNQLENVGDVEQILKEELEAEYAEIGNLEANNLCETDEYLGEVVELKDSEKRISGFHDTFFPKDKELTFKEAILYNIRFEETNLQDECSNFESEFNNVLKDDIKITLDLQDFRNTCYHINDLLSEKGYFLRVFEIKDRFREIRLKRTDKTTVQKELYSCIKPKFDGYELIASQFSRKNRQNFKSINVLYKPVRHPTAPISCFTSNDISRAYRAIVAQKGKITRAGYAFECFYCFRYFLRQDRWKKHINICSGIPGIVYNFNTQNLVTFEDNLKHKSDIPIAIYFDFETTAPTDTCYDPEQKEMFVVSYVMILCFHPYLKAPKIIVERSYGHDLHKLNSINYLNAEQMNFIDPTVVRQLSDAAAHVANRKCKNAMGQMFSVELFFLKDTILRWFNKKIKSVNLTINPDLKLEFEKKPIDWQNDTCYLCKFKLDVMPTNHETADQEMTYGDFIIRYEHKFLRNIFDPEILKNSSNLLSLKDYYAVFRKVISLVLKLQNIQQFTDLSDLDAETVLTLQKLDNSNETMQQLKNNIDNIEIKNAPGSKISNFYLRLMCYVYQNLVDFPPSNFQYETLTTKNFFKHLYRLIKTKVHLHHSHITGRIYGYTHDFCNLTVRENKAEVAVIAHNLMKFDAFYVIKGFRAPAWKTKNITMAGNNITNLNFMSIGSEVKFIDSLKYYQQSLANLTATLTTEEKNAVRDLTIQFITSHDYFANIWKFLAQHQKDKILDIVSSGKGIIPYEMVVNAESLFIEPENEFFNKTEFFSQLKNKSVSDEEYENSKDLFSLLKMRNLSDMNDLYNFQDVALLCEIVENRFQLMQDQYGFNPRKCNSSATFSGCVEREMSKIIIALPTSNEHVNIFETTLTGGFSAVNTRLAFDTELLLPNDTIDSSNYKNYNYKVMYNLNLDNETKDYRVISKILKLDENNQYGYAMTKPMPTGCIHSNNDTSFRTFNLLLESVDLDDQIGHLYIVDIKLDFEKLTDRQKVYNEICPSIIEKQKSIDIYERSTFQLLEKMELLDSGEYQRYSPTKKAHATLFEKKCFPLYLEHLALLIKRLGWVVTKIHQHITFEQKRFKKNFIIRNQKARQKAKNNVEKDFYKLLNNSNFGYDCRNNIDNCTFVPIFDELQDVSYLKKYYSYFNPAIKEFVSEDVITEEINQNYLDRLSKLKQDDPFYIVKKSAIDQTRLTELEALEAYRKKKRVSKKRKSLVEYSDYKNAISQNPNIKSVINFDSNQANSIKSLAVQTKSTVDISTRFIKGKMLMFAKTSIQSFNYDIIDVFMFPDSEIQKIYANYNIIRCLLYQNLTDTDSTSLLFIFICNANCEIKENDARKVIFEVMVNSKIKDRLDLSSDFWDKFNVQNKLLKKQVGLYEVESVDNPTLMTIAINPKEYFEMYKDKSFNKKSKGIHKDTPGMDFDSYANRIYSKFERSNDPRIVQNRFQVKTNAMSMVSIAKNKFASLNDKRFYFMNGITSLPFGHPYLEDARKAKAQFKANIQQNVARETNNFIKLERKALKKCERLLLYDTILSQSPKIMELNSTDTYHGEILKSTKDYILNGNWK